jgi:hypothetical protein
MKRSIAPLALLLLALVPATANAAVVCVPSMASGCDDSRPTISDAVLLAVDGDTVRIAAGTYPEAVATDKKLTFTGAGSGTPESAAGATVIAPPTGFGMLLLEGATIRSLRVEAGAPFGPGAPGAMAMLLQSIAGAADYVVDDVVAIGGPSPDMAGGNAVQAATLAPATLSLSVTDSDLRAGSGAGGGGAGMTTAGLGTTVTVERSRIAGGAGGGSNGLTFSETTGTISDSTLSGDMAVALFGGDYEIRRSRIAATGEPNIALQALDLIADGADTVIDVRDSLVTTGSPAGAFAVGIQAGPADPVHLSLTGSTVVSAGGMAALQSIAFGSATANVDLRNSVVRNAGPGGTDLLAQGGTISAESSSFTTAEAGPTGGAPTPGTSGNVAGDPALDAAYVPLASSPLIDRGDPAFVMPGELDLAGVARIQEGGGECGARPDIGAFERVGACSVPLPAPPVPSAPKANVAPKLSRVSLLRKSFTARKPRHEGRKRGTVVGFTLSEAARVAMSVQRRASGRRVTVRGKRRCVKPTRANAQRRACARFVKVGTLRRRGKAGRNRLRFGGKVGGRVLPPGVYRAKLTAVDAAGLRSSAKTVRFRVLRP